MLVVVDIETVNKEQIVISFVETLKRFKKIIDKECKV